MLEKILKPPKTNKEVEVRRFTERNISRLIENLESGNWEDVLLCNNTDDAYCLYWTKFESYFNTCLPKLNNRGKYKQPINPWVTKGILTSISILSPLVHIFNLSLSSGVVPASFKTAKVIPIYTKKTTPLLCRTIDQYPYYQVYLKSLKESFTTDYINV